MGEIYSPHPRQELVLLCPFQEILYGGAAGSGKSFLLIFAWLQHEKKYESKAKGLVLRKTNAELEDLVQEFKKVLGSIYGDARKMWNETKHTFTLPSGAILEMGYLDADDDKYRYHGRAFNFVAWDELTLWPDPGPYDFLLSRTRSADGVPVVVLATTNPIGVGASWVMKRWKIDKFPNGMHPVHIYTDLKSNSVLGERPDLDKLTDKQLPNHIKRWTRVFIPGRLEDNPSLDKDGMYRSQLIMRPKKIREALLGGRWDSVDGAFFEEWDPKVHVISTFKPDPSWRRWMAMDWGTAHPYCALWAAQAPNGEIYVYDELYGDGGEHNKGTMETASQVALRVRERERSRNEVVDERYLDSSCFAGHGHEMTIAQSFAKEGVVFQPAVRSNKAGSINIFREYLKVVNGNSRIKFMQSCENTIRTIPTMQFDSKDKEQYDSKGEDHPTDCCLYLMRMNTDAPVGIVGRMKDLNRANSARYSGMGVW